MKAATLFACIFAATPAIADPTESAFAVCGMIDGTGFSSKPCEVGNGEVTATLDMSAPEARDLCQKISAYAASQGLDFTDRWTLNIRSPYSDTNSIAFCAL